MSDDASLRDIHTFTIDKARPFIVMLILYLSKIHTNCPPVRATTAVHRVAHNQYSPSCL